MSSQIEAGRDTDLLIHEKVMRNRVTGVAASPGAHSLKEMEAKVADAVDVPRYTTEIAAAWPVLEWLRDLLGPEVVVAVAFYPEYGVWVCGDLMRLEPRDGANTAPLAICRAALQAYAKVVLAHEQQVSDQARERRRDHLKLEE